MNLLDIDSKINELTKELVPLNQRLEWVEGEIEDLEFEKDDIEADIAEIEGKIKKIKTNLIQTMAVDSDKFTGDQFTDCFILASMFCDREDEQRPVFNHVYFTNTEMMATDTFRAIMISNLEIPETLQNKFVRWDTRSDFNSNAVVLTNSFPNFKKLISDIVQRKPDIFNDIEPSHFYNRFHMEQHSKSDEREIITLKLTEQVAFNKEYLDIALLCFGDKPFSINFKSRLAPMLMYNENIQIVILPIRLR